MSNLGDLEPSGVDVDIWDEPPGAAVVRFVTGDPSLRSGRFDGVVTGESGFSGHGNVRLVDGSVILCRLRGAVRSAIIRREAD